MSLRTPALLISLSILMASSWMKVKSASAKPFRAAFSLACFMYSAEISRNSTCRAPKRRACSPQAPA